jgi:hypothetical protein
MSGWGRGAGDIAGNGENGAKGIYILLYLITNLQNRVLNKLEKSRAKVRTIFIQ